MMSNNNNNAVIASSINNSKTKKLFKNELDVHLYLDRLSSLGVNGQHLLSPKTDDGNDNNKTFNLEDENSKNNNNDSNNLTSYSTINPSLLDLLESNSIPTNLEFEYKNKHQRQASTSKSNNNNNDDDPMTYSISLSSVISHHEFVQKRRERLSNLNNKTLNSTSLAFSDSVDQHQPAEQQDDNSKNKEEDIKRKNRQSTTSGRSSLLQAGAFSKVFEMEQTRKREEKEREMFDALFPERICVNPDRKTFYRNPVLDADEEQQQPQDDDSNKVYYVVRDSCGDDPSTDDEDKSSNSRRFSLKMLKGRMSWMGSSSSSSALKQQQNCQSFKSRFSNLETSTSPSSGPRKSRLARLSALMASFF